MKQMAKKFKALSDETRLRLLALLSHGELCVCDLMAVLQLPQSTVSRHLAYLKNSGLIVDRRQGVWMYYRLDSQQLEDQVWKGLLLQLPQQQQTQIDKVELQNYLAQKDGLHCC